MVEEMKIFLAGCSTRIKIVEEQMKLYMAGQAPWKNEGLYDDDIKYHRPYVLESFYYIDQHTERLMPHYGDFMLDSGAFTFLANSKTKINWDMYIEEYAAYVKKHNIKQYIELDIDPIVGYKKVLEYRQTLESIVGWQCIPVWHKSRGMQEFVKMCKEYKYVAIGGIVNKEIKKTEYKYFPTMISEAHKQGCKIHGLGFTSLKWLPICHFDSVDSTAWTTGNRFGFLYYFDGKTMQKVNGPKGARIKAVKKVAKHNYIEWLKFQAYADVYL